MLIKSTYLTVPLTFYNQQLQFGSSEGCLFNCLFRDWFSQLKCILQSVLKLVFESTYMTFQTALLILLFFLPPFYNSGASLVKRSGEEKWGGRQAAVVIRLLIWG